MPHTHRIRIATRPSSMAIHQAERVAAALEALDTSVRTDLVKIVTTGDQWLGDLSKLGGKGAFVKGLDHALLDNQADLAVHCLKDIPGDHLIPDGLAFAGYLPREDLHDALISRFGASLSELPEGSIIATSSVRRAAQLHLHYPHLSVIPLRGNVDARLMRLDEGHFDAFIASVSGLGRLNLTERITEVLSLETMCPPVGAGIIALQCRAGDSEMLERADQLNDLSTNRQADAERAMLYILQGHCNSPIAGYATIDSAGWISLRGKVFSLDGTQWLNSSQQGAADDPRSLGVSVAEDLLRQGARSLMGIPPLDPSSHQRRLTLG